MAHDDDNSDYIERGGDSSISSVVVQLFPGEHGEPVHRLVHRAGHHPHVQAARGEDEDEDGDDDDGGHDDDDDDDGHDDDDDDDGDESVPRRARPL
jgi:hypothetical protein